MAGLGCLWAGKVNLGDPGPEAVAMLRVAGVPGTWWEVLPERMIRTSPANEAKLPDLSAPQVIRQ
ncbi:hypothetical protein [Streptomyces silvisoli]|uniref:Uncharacterized protein n=1 Tax=Streptomyces silvisoli TaxID=3034235 RepID=A0ABT5ZGW8_9ACTN|nr:hypothetical protein [Streptomyces silvisoli]MDF3289069.1 hypothetical protein [Streptomyces silvisoli]